MRLDEDIAERWGADAEWVERLAQWHWFRAAIPPLLQASAASAGAPDAVSVDLQALGRAFWAWVAALDHERGFEPLDRVDFAHHFSGRLLHQLIVHRPVALPAARRGQELAALTRTVLTILAAWRLALGAPIPALRIGDGQDAAWASYLEATAEDASSAVAFLDLFTGLDPVWHAPLLTLERPAMRRALARRVRDHASEAPQPGSRGPAPAS